MSDFREITIKVSPQTFNALRMTSIHRKTDVDKVVVDLINIYYDSRKKD